MVEKGVYFTQHALDQMKERNATKEEVVEAIKHGNWSPAEKGRLTTAMCFPFGREHYGRRYATKEVVPIFMEEDVRIVVITVYTFFSQKR